jgi:hypothetical protein
MAGIRHDQRSDAIALQLLEFRIGQAAVTREER